MVEAHPEGVVVADPRTGRHTHRITPTAAGRTVVAAGPSPERVVVTGANAEVIVWNGAAGRADRVYRGHTARVSALALSRDGRRLASAGGDQVVRVWDLAREPDVRTLADVGPGAGGLCVSADGTRLVIGPRAKPGAPGVLILDAATGREACRLAGSAEFAFHPTAPRVVTSRPGGGVAAWDAATGAAAWDRPLPGGVVRSVVAAPGGKRLVVSPDGRWVAHWDVRSRGVHLWAADDGTPLGTLAPEAEFVYAMAASPDGRRLAVVTPRETAVWDVAERAPTSWPAGGFAVAFTPDGTGVAVAEPDRVVRLRDAATGRPVREFVGSPLRVNDVAFRPDGTRLATAGSDDGVRVWDVASGRELLALPGVTGPVSAVAWDNTGCRLYASGDAVCVWEVGHGSPQP